MLSFGRYAEHYQRITKLALPIIAGQLSTILISFSDNAMVGQYDAISLAASAFANALLSTILLFGIGVSWSLTPLVAAADAAGNQAECQRLFKHSLALYPLVGLGLFGVAWIASFFLDRFGQAPEVVRLARPYFLVVGASVVPAMLFQALKQFLDGLSYTKEPMYINFGGALLNVLFNYLLIFGHWGLPAMGLLGAGIATLAARVVMAAALLARFFYLEKFSEYRQELAWGTLSRAMLKKLLKMGIPVGFQAGFEVSAFGFVNVMVGWMGPVALAAHQIALNVATVTFLTAMGISSATAIRVGGLFGSRDREGLRAAGLAAYHLVIGFMGTCAAFIALTRGWLPLLYLDANDPLLAQIVPISASLLIYAAIFQVSDGVQVIGMGVLRGIQDIKAPTLIALVAYWVLGVPLGYLLGFVFHFGIAGVWIGLSAGLTFAAIFLAARFFDKSRRIAM
jgi:multidrug resistance protein, MATE family